MHQAMHLPMSRFADAGIPPAPMSVMILSIRIEDISPRSPGLPSLQRPRLNMATLPPYQNGEGKQRKKMLYSYPFSFRRRKIPPYRDTASQTTTTTTSTTTTQRPRRRNKLRKRPPFRYSSTNTSTLHLASDSSDLVMGSKSSRLGDMSRPTRPPRPSADDLPDLPSLPMYHHVLTEKQHSIVVPDVGKKKPKTDLKPPELNLTDSKPAIPPKSPGRRTSICEWPLNNTPVDPHCRPRPAAKQEQHYDRASHLAESYRALLPPMSMGSGPRCVTPVVDADTQKQHCGPTQECAGNSSEKQRPVRIHTLRHLGNHQLHPEIVFPEPRVLSLTAPLYVARAPERNSQAARPPSTASSSSLTVVDVPAESPLSSAASLTDETSIYSYAPPKHRDCQDQRWSVASSNYDESDYSPTPRLDSRSDQSPSSRHSEPPFPVYHHHYNNSNHELPAQSERRTSNDLGLQICADMLADHLKRVLFLHTTDTNDSGSEMEKEKQKEREKSKLQILLLIEAYEAALASVKKEVEAVARHPPIVRGPAGDGNGIERRTTAHVREAVKILEHWLGVLYGIYDDDFGEGMCYDGTD